MVTKKEQIILLFISKCYLLRNIKRIRNLIFYKLKGSVICTLNIQAIHQQIFLFRKLTVEWYKELIIIFDTQTILVKKAHKLIIGLIYSCSMADINESLTQLCAFVNFRLFPWVFI